MDKVQLWSRCFGTHRNRIAARKEVCTIRSTTSRSEATLMFGVKIEYQMPIPELQPIHWGDHLISETVFYQHQQPQQQKTSCTSLTQLIHRPCEQVFQKFEHYLKSGVIGVGFDFSQRALILQNQLHRSWKLLSEQSKSSISRVQKNAYEPQSRRWLNTFSCMA